MVKAIALGSVDVPGAVRVGSIEEARHKARLLATKKREKVLLIGKDAWRLYAELAYEMRTNSENYFLLEALDPREAELAAISWSKLLLSRVAYTAKRPAEEAFNELGSVERKVTRRALLKGRIIGAVMEYTEKPIEDASLCNNYPALEKYCESCLSVCGIEGGCPVSAALCGIELLSLPGYTRSGLFDALRSLAPFEKPGYALIAPRSSIANILNSINGFKNPVVFVPVSCPYSVGLEELLALHAVGLQPIVIEAGWERSIKRCKESKSPYMDFVESDYVKVTGIRLVYELDEVRKLIDREPHVHRADNVDQYLARGLRALALAVLKKLGIAADLSTGFSATIKIDPNKCTICGACAYECPTNALVVKETPKVSSLLFLHDRCIACRYCEEVCPEDALRVSRAVNAGLINAWTPLILNESLHCIVCGEPLGASAMIEKTIERLIRNGQHPEKMPQLLMCLSCKQKYSLGLISDDQVDYETLYRVVNRVRRRLGLEPLELPPSRKRREQSQGYSPKD